MLSFLRFTLKNFSIPENGSEREAELDLLLFPQYLSLLRTKRFEECHFVRSCPQKGLEIAVTVMH
jgi:hypothetical protein